MGGGKRDKKERGGGEMKRERWRGGGDKRDKREREREKEPIPNKPCGFCERKAPYRRRQKE